MTNKRPSGQYSSALEWADVIAAEDDFDLRKELIKSAAGTRPFDLERIRAAVREILMAVGEDPEREGLKDTPKRVALMYQELFAGLTFDPAEHLKTVFKSEQHNEIVLLRDIEFFSTCEHHLLPIIGKAHVAYLPHKKIVGLSKLARVVEGFARRPQIQERLTNQIADAINTTLAPIGTAVIIEAKHLCMSIRGIKKFDTWMTTSAMRGEFHDDPATREELMSLVFRPSTE
jgi:GTP cyclohydrolase IA